MHILVVDDDNNIRHLFSAAFALAGHQAKTAATGTEALELVKEHRFDAVLLDVEMPTMSGWKVLEAIQRMPVSGHLPVILFTAHENPSSDAYAKILGAYALLRKPAAPTEILEVIARAIEDRKD